MSNEFTLSASESWTIPSANGEAGLRINLALPPRGKNEPVPTLVVLDGDFMFLTAVEFARTLNLVTLGDFPPVTVVGVMRDESDPLRYLTSRFRDFTPQEWRLTGPFDADNPMASMGTGGAPQFLDSLEQLVMPQVASRLNATGSELGEVAICGWSLSGLFASWAWLERPDLFPHLLAITPSLWWHHASILERPFGARPATQRVFVCAGEHEEGDVALVYPQRFANDAQRKMAAMVRNAERFGALASAAGASTLAITFPDEHHVTVQTPAISRGLRHIFG
jgi:predicted alpha/beta superfamily hydrolase